MADIERPWLASYPTDVPRSLAPFPEKSKFTVELPRNFKDDAGREPENKASFPLSTATASNSSCSASCSTSALRSSVSSSTIRIFRVLGMVFFGGPPPI